MEVKEKNPNRIIKLCVIIGLPDYKKALDNDLNLVNVITKIGELMGSIPCLEKPDSGNELWSMAQRV